MAEISNTKSTKTSNKKQPKKENVLPASVGPPKDNHARLPGL